MTSLRLRAPAKINWTLEVLGRRQDGYHDIRTVLQTIGVEDTVTLSPADELALSVRGGTRGFRRAAREDPSANLAYRAAELLRQRTRCRAGVSIRLDKHVPVASGLGGGSSDAAAVLRGLRRLWSLDIDDVALAEIAAELGSDVPFFLRGGTALASGRGEAIEPLPDIPPRRLLLAWPKAAVRADKTARMYQALRDEHFSDGSRTQTIVQRLRSGEPLRDEDLTNAFEAVLPEVAPAAARLFERASDAGLGRAHLCGSGPAFFFLDRTEADVRPLMGLGELGLATMTFPATISSAEALTVSEVP